MVSRSGLRGDGTGAGAAYIFRYLFRARLDLNPERSKCASPEADGSDVDASSTIIIGDAHCSPLVSSL